jgi:two-component system sensor histidine kinase HupT/HoxJ
VFGNMHALQRYGERITRYLGAVDEEASSPRLRELRQALKIDRILDDIGPLIDGTLEGAERVSDIVQDLRRYSGGQKEDLSRVELPKVVRKAVQWVVKASRVKPEVRYRLPDSLAMQGRKGQLHQILVNLVQNAVDAMEDQPRPVLELQCGVVGERVRIDVMDRGPGIPAADLPHIFEPFFTSKPVGQGTGLGLSISYGLAKELGGDLVAANRPQGGAVFSLTLPLQAGA